MRTMRDRLIIELYTSCLSEDEKDYWESRIHDLSFDEVNDLKTHLEMHQSEPIANGQNYKMRDINNKLNLIMSDDKK